MRYKHIGLTNFKFDAESRTFEGHASTFNNIDAYGDTVIPGAFAKTLENRERPIRMRFNHFGPVIGKFTDIREDDIGLKVKGALTPGHSVAEDAFASLKHGAIDGLSIGFRVGEGGAVQNTHGGFDLHEIDLVEISVVEEPADLGAKIGDVKDFKEAIENIETLKEAEDCLRDACGLSRSAAKALVSQIKTLYPRDAGAEKCSVDAAVKAIDKWKLNHYFSTVTEV